MIAAEMQSWFVPFSVFQLSRLQAGKPACTSCCYPGAAAQASNTATRLKLCWWNELCWIDDKNINVKISVLIKYYSF